MKGLTFRCEACLRFRPAYALKRALIGAELTPPAPERILLCNDAAACRAAQVRPQDRARA